MNRITKLAIMGLLPLTSLSTMARADVGVVAVAQNDVRVQLPGQKVRRAGAMQSLPDGSRVQVGAGGRAVVVLYKDGSRYQLGAGTAATISENGLKIESGAPAKALSALNLQQAKVLRGSHVAYGRSASVTLRGGPNFRLMSLFEGATVQDRPTFAWTPLKGATTYHVRLEGEEDQALLDQDVTGTSLAYPANKPALQPGIDYIWSVTALMGDKPMIEGIFHILSSDQKKALQAELADLQAAAPTDDDDVLSAALKAEIYRKYELLDDAVAIYADLSVKNPDSGPLHLTLSDLLGRQHRKEESDAEKAKANQLMADLPQ